MRVLPIGLKFKFLEIIFFKKVTFLGMYLFLANCVVLTLVTFPKELHSHDSKDENDDAQHESQITQSSDSFTHD